MGEAPAVAIRRTTASNRSVGLVTGNRAGELTGLTAPLINLIPLLSRGLADRLMISSMGARIEPEVLIQGLMKLTAQWPALISSPGANGNHETVASTYGELVRKLEKESYVYVWLESAQLVFEAHKDHESPGEHFVAKVPLSDEGALKEPTGLTPGLTRLIPGLPAEVARKFEFPKMGIRVEAGVLIAGLQELSGEAPVSVSYWFRGQEQPPKTFRQLLELLELFESGISSVCLEQLAEEAGTTNKLALTFEVYEQGWPNYHYILQVPIPGVEIIS